MFACDCAITVGGTSDSTEGALVELNQVLNIPNNKNDPINDGCFHHKEEKIREHSVVLTHLDHIVDGTILSSSPRADQWPPSEVH